MSNTEVLILSNLKHLIIHHSKFGVRCFFEAAFINSIALGNPPTP